MTSFVSRAAVEQFRPQIDRALRDGWQKVPFDDGEDLEEAYTAGLHPRGRAGQWVDAPDRPKTKPPAPAKPLDLPHDRYDKYVPPFDADVQAITDGASAEAVLKGLGIEAHLDMAKGCASESPGPEQVRFLREITQATKDAIARSPSLKQGPWARLGGVSLISNLPQDRIDLLKREGYLTGAGTWATTSPSALVTNGSWLTHDDTGRRIIETAVAKRDGVWIYINDVNPPVSRTLGTRHPEQITGHRDGAHVGNAKADSSVYGRMTHELGHAVAMTSGFAYDYPHQPVQNTGAHEYLAMADAQISKDLVREHISEYGSVNPLESWAEIYTTLNTPHGMDGMIPLMREKLADLKAAATFNGARIL